MKSCENCICFNYNLKDQVRPHFSTCHDSTAVVTCAKLWPDLVIIYHISVTCHFTRFGWWALNRSWDGSQECTSLLAQLLRIRSAHSQRVGCGLVDGDRGVVHKDGVCEFEMYEGRPLRLLVVQLRNFRKYEPSVMFLFRLMINMIKYSKWDLTPLVIHCSVYTSLFCFYHWNDNIKWRYHHKRIYQ